MKIRIKKLAVSLMLLSLFSSYSMPLVSYASESTEEPSESVDTSIHNEVQKEEEKEEEKEVLESKESVKSESNQDSNDSDDNVNDEEYIEDNKSSTLPEVEEKVSETHEEGPNESSSKEPEKEINEKVSEQVLEVRDSQYEAKISTEGYSLYSEPSNTEEANAIGTTDEYLDMIVSVKKEVDTETATWANIMLEDKELGWVNIEALEKKDQEQITTFSMAKPEMPSISYSTHVQSIGWQKPVKDGALSGTEGQRKRLEAIKINIESMPGLSVEYSTHVQSNGWLDWVSNGQSSGTTNQQKRLEAIKIKLSGEQAKNYDIYYRVHAETFGWLDWAKNGEEAGTAGFSKRLEAIEIVLVKKGGEAPGLIDEPFLEKHPLPTISYQTHIQRIGWQNKKTNGMTSGTTGQGKRLEAIKINLSSSIFEGSVRYRTHVQSYGWQDWVSENGMSGTSGQAKRLEAISIELTGEMAKHYDIYYRVHSEKFGWLGWAKNGSPAGTEGYAYRLEAIEIKVVNKDNIGYNEYGTPFQVKNDHYTYGTNVKRENMVPFDIEYIYDSSLKENQKTILRYGKDGYEEIYYSELYKGSKVIFSSEYNKKIYKPISQVEIIGTQPIATEIVINNDQKKESILKFGENIKLNAQVIPHDVPQDVEWRVNSNMGSIDTNGIFTAGNISGNVIVEAHAKDGSGVIGTHTIHILYPTTLSKYIGNETNIEIKEVINGTNALNYDYDEFQIGNVLYSKYKQSLFYNALASDAYGYITEIGYKAFQNKGMSSVKIPDSVKIIWQSAFAENNLSEIILPNKLESIEFGAFSNNSLTSVDIPDSVTKIDNNAFSNNNLEYIELPVSLTIVGNGAFQSNKISDFDYSKSLKIIGEHAFKNNNFTKLHLTEGIEEIQLGAFKENFIEEITLPTSLINIGQSAFEDNYISELTIPENVETISNRAFLGNEISKLNLGNKVKEIGNLAFYSNNIKSLEISNSVTTIGNSAFAFNDIEQLFIPDSVTTIEEKAFYYNRTINKLRLPKNLKVIPQEAFAMNKLTEIEIPHSVATIEPLAFANNNITKITIGSDVDIKPNMLDSNNNLFRDAYLEGGAGTYIGTQKGEWTKIVFE